MAPISGACVRGLMMSGVGRSQVTDAVGVHCSAMCGGARPGELGGHSILVTPVLNSQNWRRELLSRGCSSKTTICSSILDHLQCSSDVRPWPWPWPWP